jgi:hypothetical protein
VAFRMDNGLTSFKFNGYLFLMPNMHCKEKAMKAPDEAFLSGMRLRLLLTSGPCGKLGCLLPEMALQY